MRIIFGIGKPMMIAMMSSPPQRPLLSSGGAEDCQQELEYSARFIGSMGEIAMITDRNSDHPNEIKSYAGSERHLTDTRPNRQQAGYMHEKETRGIQQIG
jgi:hypothetical protein